MNNDSNESMMKEITVFAEGDSNHANVWSNIPFFLTNTLESQGYIVNRVNVYGNTFFRFLYDKVFCRFLRHTFMRNTTFSYERSLLYTLDWKMRIRKSLKKFPNSYCYISTSFSFSPSSFTNKPCVLFCDWTYDYYFHYFLNRDPDFLEAMEVNRQNQVIEDASDIFVLFPDVAEYMKQYYHNSHIYYLGNVINAESAAPPSSFSSKHQKLRILFIGLKKYKEGADSLIQALGLLQDSYPDIALDIIGMEEKDFQSLPAFVTCHGYLSKDILSQKCLYDSILQNATLYVNTTPRWAGFSSALEALYHYIPIITTPYTSFIETFGDEIAFGHYCSSNEPALIAQKVIFIIQTTLDDYAKLCQDAHESVLDFTWDAYVDKMLKKIEQNLS